MLLLKPDFHETARIGLAVSFFAPVVGVVMMDPINWELLEMIAAMNQVEMHHLVIKFVFGFPRGLPPKNRDSV